MLWLFGRNIDGIRFEFYTFSGSSMISPYYLSALGMIQQWGVSIFHFLPSMGFPYQSSFLINDACTFQTSLALHFQMLHILLLKKGQDALKMEREYWQLSFRSWDKQCSSATWKKEAALRLKTTTTRIFHPPPPSHTAQTSGRCSDVCYCQFCQIILT